MQLKIKKLHPDAIIPTRNNPTDSGLDLYSLEDVTIQPGQTVLIKTGIAFEIPEGHEVQVRPRSGMSLKTKFRIANSPGTVDFSYKGDVSAIGFHAGFKEDADIIIKKGDRIAQAVLCPVSIVETVVVDSLTETTRGAKGFGSSGT